MGLDQQLKDGQRRCVRDSMEIVKTAVRDGGTFVLEWGAGARAEADARATKDGTPRMASLPSYYRVDGNMLVAIAEADVPLDTGLVEKHFEQPRGRGRYTACLNDADFSAHCKAGPFTANLTDGSEVTYGWFRFVEQPSLRKLLERWTPSEREALQNMVERVHAAWCKKKGSGDEVSFIPHPASGSALAAFDDGIILEPPEGLSVGYVPVALCQTGRG